MSETLHSIQRTQGGADGIVSAHGLVHGGNHFGMHTPNTAADSEQERTAARALDDEGGRMLAVDLRQRLGQFLWHGAAEALERREICGDVAGRGKFDIPAGARGKFCVGQPAPFLLYGIEARGVRPRIARSAHYRPSNEHIAVLGRMIEHAPDGVGHGIGSSERQRAGAPVAVGEVEHGNRYVLQDAGEEVGQIEPQPRLAVERMRHEQPICGGRITNHHTLADFGEHRVDRLERGEGAVLRFVLANLPAEGERRVGNDQIEARFRFEHQWEKPFEIAVNHVALAAEAAGDVGDVGGWVDVDAKEPL